MKSLTNNNIYSYSKLTKKAGVGSRYAWRKIVKNQEFGKYFNVLVETRYGVEIKTDLTVVALRKIYKEYLELMNEKALEGSKKGVKVRLSKVKAA